VVNVLAAAELVLGPASDDDAFEEHTVGGTDTCEPQLESMSTGEVEGLSVEIMYGFFSDGLVDAKDDWLESGAVGIVAALTLGLVSVTAPRSSRSFQVAAVDFTATGLASVAEISGRLDEACLVDHEADLKWQLHEGEGNVLNLLGLLLALLGSLLLLLGLDLSLDGVR
jgi:hypothetical protein